jgi:hypothetical protein
MEFVRENLLATLKLVAPALNDKQPMVPVMSHLCFDGKHVVAYDGVVALHAPCTLDFVGALPGTLLLSMLGASAVKLVDIEATESEVVVKLGRAKLKLASLPEADFVFSPPYYRKGSTRLVLDENLLDAFRLVARSAGVSDDVSRSGITMKFVSRGVILYASDDRTLARCQVDLGGVLPDAESIIIPERFYSLMLKMEPKELLITKSGDLVALSQDANPILFGRVQQGANPDQYESVFGSAHWQDVPKTLMGEFLPRCLERAKLVNSELVTLAYTPGRLGVSSTGLGGELSDSCKLDFGEDSFEVVTCPECILRYTDTLKHIGICDRGIMLEGTDFCVLVAVQQKGRTA